ncbi:cytochrome P450 [Nocardia tengchongensis]|uniref:cytochrome P450 family protein n=1 Tax=Nocardia tengchongensis TaxID=2055889 RepID=UPI003401510B
MIDEQPIVLTDEFFQDPHTTYERLRERGPVHHVRFPHGVIGWLVTDYALARQVLSEPTISKDLRAVADDNRLVGGATVADPGNSQHMLNADPPHHTRMRKLVDRAFTPAAVAALAPRITAIADELLDTIAPGETVDLLRQYAFPLPITVICELLGVPAADRTDFQRWSAELVTAQSHAAKADANTQLAKYLDDLIAERRSDGGADLLSGLIRATEAGDRLSPDELRSNALLLLVAGHETTVNLIASSVLALPDDVRVRREIATDPRATKAFREEVLRYHSPVHITTFRYTTTPITLADVRIEAGELIMVSLAAGNRDHGRFADPDTFHPDRIDNHHIAFGYGAHYCLGAPLARLETDIALSRLLTRFPALTLAIDSARLRWRPSVVIRGLTELPVHCR